MVKTSCITKRSLQNDFICGTADKILSQTAVYMNTVPHKISKSNKLLNGATHTYKATEE